MADSQKNSRHPRMAVVLGVVLIVLGVFNLAGNVFPRRYMVSPRADHACSLGNYMAERVRCRGCVSGMGF